MPLHILGHDSCDQINVTDRNNRVTTMMIKDTYKDIFLKTLSKGLFSRFNDKVTKENTIIVDDSSMMHILNNSKKILLLLSWLYDRASPSNMFLIDTLLPWLQQLYRSQNVRVSARIHNKIHQSMLFDEPSSIEYYVEIKDAINNIHSSSNCH